MLLILLFCTLSKIFAQTENDLFKISENVEILTEEANTKRKTILEGRQEMVSYLMELQNEIDNIVDVNQISLYLPELEQSLVFKKSEISYQSEENNFWYGNDESNSATLAFALGQENRNEITMQINTGKEVYQIFNLSEKNFLMIKLAQEVITEANPIIIDGSEAIDGGESFPAANCVIDVMVLYTNKALITTPNISSLINLSIGQVNQAFKNSKINHTVKLVYQQIAAMQEAATASATLTNFRNDGTTVALRNKYKADVAILLTNATTFGTTVGISYLEANANTAFGVVQTAYATAKYTFAHEFGHIMGADHQIGGGPQTTSAYAHGYKVGANSTILHTLDNNLPRILYYSNPSVFYNGKATGTTKSENNARKITERGCIVSKFR